MFLTPKPDRYFFIFFFLVFCEVRDSSPRMSIYRIGCAPLHTHTQIPTWIAYFAYISSSSCCTTRQPSGLIGRTPIHLSTEVCALPHVSIVLWYHCFGGIFTLLFFRQSPSKRFAFRRSTWIEECVNEKRARQQYTPPGRADKQIGKRP